MSLIGVILFMFLGFLLGVSEKMLMFIWLAYIPIFCIAVLVFYFGSTCPWCNELFYFVNVFERSGAKFPNLLSTKCHNCSRGKNSNKSEET